VTSHVLKAYKSIGDLQLPNS